MRSGFCRFISLALCWFTVFPANSWAYTYIVKRGNSLSAIAHNLIPGRVWRKGGSLERLLRLNPHIKNPDLIYPGEQIDIDGVVTLAQQKALGITRAPSSVEEPKELEPVVNVGQPQSNRYSLWTVAPVYALGSVAAKDQTTGTAAVLATQINLGVDIQYEQIWSPSFKSFFQLHLQEVMFEEPADSTKSLQGGKRFLSGIGFGIETPLSQRWRLLLNVDYKRELFIRAVSTQSVTVDSVSIPSVSAQASYDAIRAEPFVVGVSSILSLKMPATPGSYTVGRGTSYGGTIYLQQFSNAKKQSGKSFSAPDLTTELGFIRRSQNTSITTQVQTDIFLKLKFPLPSSGESKKGKN